MNEINEKKLRKEINMWIRNFDGDLKDFDKRITKLENKTPIFKEIKEIDETRIDYQLVVKNKSNLQKVFNQWKHLYELEIISMFYDDKTHLYHTLIKRTETVRII